jgi:hypothetical protein
VLLVTAGGAKLVRPGETALALSRAGLPFGRRAVRAGAVAEMLIGAAAVAWPGPISGLLVGLSYAGFAIFVVLAVRRGWALSSCGCFGRADARPTYLHAGLDAAAALAAVGWAVAAPHRLSAVFAHQPGAGVPLSLLSLVIAGLAYAIWTNPVARVPR